MGEGRGRRVFRHVKRFNSIEGQTLNIPFFRAKVYLIRAWHSVLHRQQLGGLDEYSIAWRMMAGKVWQKSPDSSKGIPQIAEHAGNSFATGAKERRWTGLTPSEFKAAR